MVLDFPVETDSTVRAPDFSTKKRLPDSAVALASEAKPLADWTPVGLRVLWLITKPKQH